MTWANRTFLLYQRVHGTLEQALRKVTRSYSHKQADPTTFSRALFHLILTKTVNLNVTQEDNQEYIIIIIVILIKIQHNKVQRATV